MKINGMEKYIIKCLKRKELLNKGRSQIATYSIVI